MTDDASTRFPFINLEKAIGRAQTLYAADKAGKPMLANVAFGLWGYSPKSSGAFQTIAALKQYGLIFDDGSNVDRRIGLTAEARRYFLDERDDVRSRLLAEFALKPALIRVLWTSERWSEGIPADTVARSYLKIDRHLNEQSARALLSIFKDNIRFSGLKPSISPEPLLESETAANVAEPKAETEKARMPEANAERTDAVVSVSAAAFQQQKPIIFDMETVTVAARFEFAEDVQEFIEKLQKLQPLMATKH